MPISEPSKSTDPAGPAANFVVKRCLISVYDKARLEEFGAALQSLGIEILASGGTAAALQAAGVAVVSVDAFTGAPEVLGGRVKTLHPRIHAGILADRREPAHMHQLVDHQFPPIDLVVCNLYPFAAALQAGAPRAELIEKIDIGGPTLLRAAAKNVDGGVTVVGSADDYHAVALCLAQNNRVVSPALRQRLAAAAFAQVAEYDAAIAGWFNVPGPTAASVPPSEATPSEEPKPAASLPPEVRFVHQAELRYGENPHQHAALYTAAPTSGHSPARGIAQGTQLGGKPLSYTNYLDMDAAFACAAALAGPACAIVKHTNPCGLAQAATQKEAFLQALAGDPQSAFGGVLGFNAPLQAEAATAIMEAKLFVECVVAPGFTPQSREILQGKAQLRLFAVPEAPKGMATALHAHSIGGGLLLQQADSVAQLQQQSAAWQQVTKVPLQPGWREELQFAMAAVALLKSNAIAVVREGALVGVGTGQTSRVDAAEQALKKAQGRAQGAFMASDAFFPFADCVRLAAAAGIAAIAQPGGSKRDVESIAACDAAGLAMVFTGTRHFRH
jgi:phosphoribosylaminoimidazolecarboxamide formyltransferase/IMP cyclohydrolase